MSTKRGRKPRPPSPEDHLSELLLDASSVLVEMHADETRHQRRQHERRRTLAGLLTNAHTTWRMVRGQQADVIPFPQRPSVPPTEPNEQRVAA